jgi:hypothetical protein
MVIGSILTSDEEVDQIFLVSAKFQKWASIMTKEAAQSQLEHNPHDHTVDVNDEEIPPWGPYYALSEKALEVLLDWLTEMLETGKFDGPSHDPGRLFYLIQRCTAEG